VGKPYDPDHRLSDYLLFKSYSQLNNKAQADTLAAAIENYAAEKNTHS
jgi:hypothetical protein